MHATTIQLKSDERGFVYLDYFGKRLMTFRGEQKLILRQRMKQIEEEIANEPRSQIYTREGAVVADTKSGDAPSLDEYQVEF